MTRPRARALGIPFDGIPGPRNAITDVAGVLVGTRTLWAGDGPLRVGQGPVRTGVTAILPRGHDGIGSGCAAGCFTLNGNGEMTGTAWIEEAGILSLPVLVTNTHAVGSCHRGVIDWVVLNRPALAREWLLPVVAETWDGYLNDINGSHVRPEHAGEAIAAAATTVAEGSVGGGTGMNGYGFKAGSGTASRQVRFGADTLTVGVFVQANFGARHELVIAGVPVGRQLADDNPMAAARPAGAGSVIVVLATDAPLLPGQLKALARRVPLGLARTGTAGSHFSGDLFLAFSTANAGSFAIGFPQREPSYADLRFLPWSCLDPFYEAVVQGVEEAVINALVAADTSVGRDGHRSPGLPIARILDLLGNRLASAAG